MEPDSVPDKLLGGDGDGQEDDSLAQVNLAYEDPPAGSPHGTAEDPAEREGKYGFCDCLPYVQNLQLVTLLYIP